MLPGGGSFQSANVRIRTRRRGSGTTARGSQGKPSRLVYSLSIIYI
jgi:hypothetical protein